MFEIIAIPTTPNIKSNNNLAKTILSPHVKILVIIGSAEKRGYWLFSFDKNARGERNSFLLNGFGIDLEIERGKRSIS